MKCKYGMLVCLALALSACGAESLDPNVGSETTPSPLGPDARARGAVAVDAGMPTIVYLSFDAANTGGNSSGLVNYISSANTNNSTIKYYFAGRADCVFRSGTEVGISGTMIHTDFIASYFFLEVQEGAPDGVRVRVAQTPFPCDALSHVYRPVIEGDLEVSGP